MPAQKNQEVNINFVLAELLREHNIDAQAEIVVGRKRLDIQIKRPDDAIIYLEAEYMPAHTVEAEAQSRLRDMPSFCPPPQHARSVAFAIKYPPELKQVKQGDLAQRMRASNICWRVFYGVSNPNSKKDELIIRPRQPEQGNIADLVEAIRTIEVEIYSLGAAVDILDRGTLTAGGRLDSDDIAEIARKIFKNDSYQPSHEVDETARMSALIVINAMVFHERLSSPNPQIANLEQTKESETSHKTAFLEQWDKILAIDYHPIFRMAYDIAMTIAADKAQPFLYECYRSATALIATAPAGGHDIAGHIFNRLVSDRKFVAAFYTRIPIATLLAGLALTPHRWRHINWEDPKQIRALRVLDPACGTGTLLMAAYKQIQANARIGGGDTQSVRFHKTMIEDVIHGMDVVQAAIHLTASTLASIAPEIQFENMNLHVPAFGIAEDGAAHLGSLDFLKSGESGAQSVFSTSSETVGPKSSYAMQTIQLPQSDLIIANPPYTRFGSGKGGLSSRIFGQFEDNSPELSGELSKTLKNTPADQLAGLASAFIVLADKRIKPGGRIAFVLPSTVLTGSSWIKIRTLLTNKYKVEFVVTAHSDASVSLSYDTNMNEVLVVARRLQNNEKPDSAALFVNLSQVPQDNYEALRLVKAINKVCESPVKAVDGPPVGGTPIGGEMVDRQWKTSVQWGEALKAPLHGETWGATAWRAGTTAQFVWNMYEYGRLWSADGHHLIETFEITTLHDIGTLGPYDLQIKGTTAPFNIYENWNLKDNYPALWHHPNTIKTMQQKPNAHLEVKPNTIKHKAIWDRAGGLQIARFLRYNSQAQSAVYTERVTLGVNSWFSFKLNADGDKARQYEIALMLWLNSTFGFCCRVAHSTHSQKGRGILSTKSLSTLPVLNVTKLQDWQLHAAAEIWNEFKERPFQRFHKLHEDEARVELDNRLIKEVFALKDDAVQALARLRELLANEPTVNGGR